MDIQTIKFMPSLQVKYEASGKSSRLLAKNDTSRLQLYCKIPKYSMMV